SDVGPGSPTGIVRVVNDVWFQDWTFGTIYRAAALPAGAGARADATPFVTGQPLPLTAIVVADDALLLLTGGRGLPSQLYRIRPDSLGTGPSSSPAVPFLETRGVQQRCRLEKFPGHADPAAVDAAWPSLGDDEPFLRYAARIALEWQPVAQWR